jgi:CDP-4-dehydro-6-deoxyglucose reductase, E1
MATKTELLQKMQVLVQQYCNENYDFSFDPKSPVVRLHEPTFADQEIFAALKVMLSTYVTMGKEVELFEQQSSALFGFKHGVLNNSGSSANLLAIAAMTRASVPDHLKPGDEVIVPALTWSTTIWPVIQYQLVPVFVDSDLNTFNMLPEKVESAITTKTRAIMPVHIYGNPCDMDAIAAIAKKHNLHMIEDCCESMGATYRGKPIGYHSRIATFSYYYSHHITTLEGGICHTDDFQLAELMRMLRSHGWHRHCEDKQKYTAQYADFDPRFIFIETGYNLRATEVQAAFGQYQLPKLKGLVEKRRAAASDYLYRLDKYKDYFQFQQETPHAESSWFGFSLILRDNAPFTVKEITSFLNAHNIETRPVIAGNMTRHPAMKTLNYRIAGDLNNADTVMDKGFAVGCHHAIDAQARDYVINTIEEFLKRKG